MGGYLSDIARRRIAALILVVGVLLVVLAITDTLFFDDPPTDEELAGDAVQEFFASAESDPDRFCELLTAGARDAMRQSVARLLQDTEGRASCADIVSERIAPEMGDIEVKVRNVSVSGNRARVDTATKQPGEPSQIRTVLLEQNGDGQWLIYDLG